MTAARALVTETCPSCGYVCEAKTAAQARYGLSRHSCDKHRRSEAARARGDVRGATYGTVVRECSHTRTHHEHGTRSAYVLDRCRCAPCSRANVAAERTRQRQKAYGRWQPYIDATPARDHVLALIARGVGAKTIAQRSGVSHGSIAKLLYGDAARNLAPSKRIRPATAEQILALPLDEVETLAAAGARVDATQTWNRIRGLVALGYSKAWISGQIGQGGRALQLHGTTVTAANARAVAALADRVGDRPGPSARARDYAAARGWLTPTQQWAATLGGDDSTPVVDDIAIERFLAGNDVPLSRADRDELASRLATEGLTVAQIAARMRTSKATVRGALRRLDADVDINTEAGAA